MQKKWYAEQNDMRKMVIGKNGMDKMICRQNGMPTKWYADKMVCRQNGMWKSGVRKNCYADKMVCGQNGTDKIINQSITSASVDYMIFSSIQLLIRSSLGLLCLLITYL